jgi:3' terminal RNA ribose 2'-O-methyltransferase Hen1
LLDVDPVGLVRGRRGPSGEGRALEQYVNDRPYVASSFLSVAIAEVFGTALSGKSKDRPELAARPIPLEARVAVLPCRGGDSFLRRLFEPLGYEVAATQHALDETREDWGSSRYFTVSLRAQKRLCDLLSHLYVLVPVLDDDKHYWVGEDEVRKLLRRGQGWLSAHPERDAITSRYLRRQRSLVRLALDQLNEEEYPEAVDEGASAREEEELERRISLNDERLGAVIAALKQQGAKRVLDLGCGEGRLVAALLKDKSFEELVGVDVSHRALEIAARRLRLDRLPAMQRDRVKLFQSSLTYRDPRLSGYDAAAVVEVIEHLDPFRLATFERVLFDFVRPRCIVLTTPNAEYNVEFQGLAPGRFRHRDHRFEWSRAELEAWSKAAAARFGYEVRFLPVGPEAPAIGAPTQMAVFAR